MIFCYRNLLICNSQANVNTSHEATPDQQFYAVLSAAAEQESQDRRGGCQGCRGRRMDAGREAETEEGQFCQPEIHVRKRRDPKEKQRRWH